MRRIAPVLFAAVAAVAAAAAAPAAADPVGNPPITGGSAATDGQFPNVVAVVVTSSGGTGLCTGTLIQPDWVVTAGHCVLPSESGFTTQAEQTAATRVYVSTLNAFGGGEGLTADMTMPDPMFNIDALGSHDMGLIHLTSPTTGITPAQLNFTAADAPIGLAVTQVGYGNTDGTTNSGAGVLHFVGQTTIDCSGIGDNANLLCFNQTNGKGKCNGDSGGPSFAMIDGKQIEVGTTSFGDETCTQYGADTRTDAEKAWLLQNIPDLECSVDADCLDMKICFEHACIVQPFTPGGLGSTCSAGSNCDSGTCGTVGTDTDCTMGCTNGDATSCPSGFDCIPAGGTNYDCWPSSSGGGCCSAGGGAPTAAVGFLLVGLVLRRSRKAKRAER